jgi:scyllo-inositol 2-dehydrogenase (NADP+)
MINSKTYNIYFQPNLAVLNAALIYLEKREKGMKIGIVGSGGIVNTFVDAVKEAHGVELVAIWCREKSIEKGKTIAKKGSFNKVYTDYELMLKDEEVEFVYIALPNDLHYLYSKRALEAGKNVIDEKPFTSTAEEAETLINLAKRKNLFLFEAITTLHLPNYKLIKEKLKEIGDIKIVTCNYSQYSSRYDAFLKGQIHPVFNPELSGGALMDINIYNLHFIFGLFGKAKGVKYLANIAHNGVDTSGIVTLKYDRFAGVCIGAKDCGCESTCYIEGTKGYIKVNSPANQCLSFEMCLNGSKPETFNVQTISNRMVYEMDDFKEIFNSKNYEECYHLLDHSLNVIKAAVEARRNAKIVFKADINK